MSKYIFAIYIVLFLIFAKSCKALDAFIPSTPLDFTYSNDDWHETEHTQASVLLENGTFKQWYTSRRGNLNIGVATSLDGLNWSNIKLINIPTGFHDVYDSALLKVSDSYHLYFALGDNSSVKIMRINSLDGLDFDSKSITSVLTPSEGWETNDVNSPTIFYEGGKYYLFYTGHDEKWEMGLAISNDGLNFTKCINNPILRNDTVPKSVLKLSNTYYLFFHSPNGIEYMETDKLGCDSVWKNRTVVLPYGFFPYVIQNGNELWMYYSTLNNGQWKMNLAVSKLQVQASGNKPVILIPGMFASWNKEAILHNQVVSMSDWQLNPIVNEYDGITKSLENIGYQKNVDYFVYPYDWRKPVEQSADDLNNFISGLHLNQKPSLVGHSLGGLVGRIYAQKNDQLNIDTLVTVGTPHQGTALVYPAVEAGETDSRDQKMWLAEKLVLQLYRNGLESDREIMNTNFPVLRDMLPTYNFLKNNGEDISLSKMAVHNNLLSQYNMTFGSLFDQLHTVVGEVGSTILGYTVSKQNIIDSLFGNYPDGRPNDFLYSPGDSTIISFSASAGNNPTVLNKSHGALMYSKEGIKAVLQSLGIPINDSQITEGHGTNIFPSLLFLMLSPAQLEVTGNNKTYQEHEGMIFIENPGDGLYTIRAKGLERGRYTILVGQLTQEKVVWNRIEGEVTKDPPASQIDAYEFTYNSSVPSPAILTADKLFSELFMLLGEIDKPTNPKIGKANDFMNKALTAHNEGHNVQEQAFLRQATNSMIQEYESFSSEEKLKIFRIMDQIELLYSHIAPMNNARALTEILKNLKTSLTKTEERYLSLKQQGSNLHDEAYVLSLIDQKITLAQDAILNKNYGYGEALINDGKLLLQTLTGHN